MAMLIVLDQTGETRTQWDPTRPDEVSSAREQFDSLRRRGYVAYSVNPDGSADSVLNAFDEKAGQVIMRPAMAGG